MEQFHGLLKRVIIEGDVVRDPRTEVHTIGISGHQYSVDLREQFPLHTTRRIYPKLAAEELLWKLRGERDVKSLVERGVDYWTKNAFDRHLKTNNLRHVFPKNTKSWANEFLRYEERLKNGQESGDLGPVYGNQWRHWKNSKGEEVDQLTDLLDKLKDPAKRNGRYNILDAWNPGETPDMAIGPCPFWHQFVVKDNYLDLHEVQRSCDSFLGIPYNDAQDAMFAHLMAKETGLTPRFFTHTFIDTHIYTGVPPRSDFWDDEKNVQNFKEKFANVKNGNGFLILRDWYLASAPAEEKVNEGMDHIPDVLTQLSYHPRVSPRIELKDVPLMEAINLPYKEVLSIKGYHPHEWKSKAVMAA